MQAEALYRLAVTDHLTGCYNRRFFEDVVVRELRRHQRYGIPMAVLFIDVDDLKRVNDSHGHLEGDRVLRQVAQFLGRHIRGSDYVFRWGGDEFLVLSGCTREQADQKAAQLKAAFAQTAVAQHLPPGIGLSIGCAEFGAEHGAVHEVLRLADRQMYEDKQRPRTASKSGETAAVDGDRKETEAPVGADRGLFPARALTRSRGLEQAVAEAVARCERLAAEHAHDREALEAARRQAEIRSRVLAERHAAERSAAEALWTAEAARYHELLAQAEAERARLVEAAREADGRYVVYQAEVREQLTVLAAALSAVERLIGSLTAPPETRRQPPDE